MNTRFYFCNQTNNTCRPVIDPLFLLLIDLHTFYCTTKLWAHLWAVCVSVSPRTFRLYLKRDAGAFSEDFTVVSENGSTSADLSHIYSGTLDGGYNLQAEVKWLPWKLLIILNQQTFIIFVVCIQTSGSTSVSGKTFLIIEEVCRLNESQFISFSVLPHMSPLVSLWCLSDASNLYVALSIFMIFTCLTLTCYLSWPGLAGEHGSACHGSVLQGQFEGMIHTDNGTYHIEPVQRYASRETHHHSIIYHEDDMGKTVFRFPLKGDLLCNFFFFFLSFSVFYMFFCM